MEKCKTLGGNSFFYFCVNEESRTLTIRTGANPEDFEINFGAAINDVWSRITNAPTDVLKRQTSYYNQPRWPEAPNMIYSPYVAKLLLDVCPNEQIQLMITI